MKVLLTYDRYLKEGKQYQAKFIYDDVFEAEEISSCISSINTNNQFKTQPEQFIKNNKTTSVIGRTNIPKDLLLSFISMLLTMNNSTIIIDNKKFTKDKQDGIEEAIDNLHININLNKGKYFHLNNCYYVTFKYATDDQRSEVYYDFNANLYPLIGQYSTLDNSPYLFPFIIDQFGNLTFNNTGIIGGTNIPEEALGFFLTKFINEYNGIITIGNEKFKDTVDSKRLITDISTIQEPTEKTKSRKIN